MRVLVRLSDGLAHVERMACRALLSALAALLVANVALRYLFSAPLFFAEEVAALILVWAGFLSVLVSIERGEQVAVTVLVDLLPPSARRFAGVVVGLLSIAVLASVGWAVFRWILSPVVAFDRVISLDVPKWPLYAVVPYVCVAGAVHVAARIVHPIAPPPP